MATPVFYGSLRAIVSVVLRLFFRIEPPADPTSSLALSGSVIFIGNHPNGLVDPALLFALVQRPVTFLAKSPLFSMPLLGCLLRAVDALPVYRKQDGGHDMAKNEGTLSAAVEALVQGRAITLFPEGKSHSEPQLAELKTGAARIALEAARRGAQVKVVPVGITYSQKNRFRSRVHVEVGQPLEVPCSPDARPPDEREAVRQLTGLMAEGLRAVTLNLEAWEDLPILQTAEALFALEVGDSGGAGDESRLKAFARGMALLRGEQPLRFEALQKRVALFSERLSLLRVVPDALVFRYRPSTVALFVVRNLVWLLGLPLFSVGMALFALPYLIPALVVSLAGAERDLESTVKVAVAVVVAPLWWGGLTAMVLWNAGVALAVAAAMAVPALALFTRWYFERRSAAVRDARVFLVLASRRRLRASLVAEGEALARDVAQVAEELRPRVRTP